MQGMEVILPGGLPNNGGIECKARFLPLTGSIEQTLIELEPGMNRPAYVTAVLDSALDRIGEQTVDAESVAELCVADRQYLMLRLAAMLDGEQVWLKVGCGNCDGLFDLVQVDIERVRIDIDEHRLRAEITDRLRGREKA